MYRVESKYRIIESKWKRKEKIQGGGRRGKREIKIITAGVAGVSRGLMSILINYNATTAVRCITLARQLSLRANNWLTDQDCTL
jgi:hypothetical protein